MEKELIAILTERVRKENSYVYDAKSIAESKYDRLVEYLALLAEKVFDGEDPLGLKNVEGRTTTGENEGESSE